MNVQDAIERAKAIAAKLGAGGSGGLPPRSGDSGGHYSSQNKRPYDDSTNRSSESSGGGRYSRPAVYGLGKARQGEEVRVPACQMGLVIGKGGEHLRLIERSFSVKINVVTQEPGSFDKERILNLVGEDSNVAKAKDTIAELIETGTMPSSLFTQFERDIATIEVPGHKVGLIIGRGGETIQSLQEKSGARIMVAADQDRSAPMKKVSIKGPPAAIEKAKELINEVLNAPSTHQSQQQDRRDTRHHEIMIVPNDKVGLVIGKGGDTIRTLQQQHGVRINVEQPDGSHERKITLTGDPQAIEATKAGIMEKIGPAPGHHQGFGGGDPYGQPPQGYGQPGFDPMMGQQQHGMYPPLPPHMMMYGQQQQLQQQHHHPQEDYTVEEYMRYYEWYMSVTGGTADSNQPPPPPGFESGFHHMEDTDGAPPGMDMPPGMEAPPGMEMPPGF